MNKKNLIIISVLCIVSGIISLVVYFVTRKKNDGDKTPSPHPSSHVPSPHGQSPHGQSPHGPSSHVPSPHGPSPHGPSPHGPSPSKKQSVTFQIENLPSFSYPCPSPSPSPSSSPSPNSGQPCIQPEGFMIGWSEGHKAIGIPKYGKSITENPSFKISDEKLIIGAINFIASKHCTLSNNTPCFSIWFYGSATNQNLQSICQNLGDCSINIKIKDETHILNMNDISGKSIVSDKGLWGATFYWKNPENIGTEGKEGKEGMWPMPKAGDKVTISITQSTNL